MPRIPDDPTIYAGMRLYDGTDYDSIVDSVEYGGFGVIAFGPNQLDGARITAFKTLRRELLDDPQTRASFVRECLLWIGMWTHANVALAYGVVEMGDTQGLRPFLALAFAEYGSLRALLRNGAQGQSHRLSLKLGLDLAQQIAAGLAYLHQPDPAYLRTEPTVHRDLKPENVLLMSDGRAVITDFGLAKAVEESPTAVALLLAQNSMFGLRGQPGQQAEEAILIGGEQVTQTTGIHTRGGAALGTLAYMAPEQWDDARYAGTPADIYALGIMLSEILAGRHALLDLDQPHTQDDWRRAHHDPHPRPMREVAPDIPEVIEAIYRRCLARDPEDRPTAAEALAALQEGARVAGEEVYVPYELAPHIPYNEWVHWHQWSNACFRFRLFQDALMRNGRALELARQIKDERPDSLAKTLLTRGTILKQLGAEALEAGDFAEAARLDQQVEAAYQESLQIRPPVTTPEGRRGRAYVWKQIGVFNSERQRYAHADDAYGRALALQPDMADTYYNRALNQRNWGLAEERTGGHDSANAHLRQARVYAVTALGMNLPPAGGLLQNIEDALGRLGDTP
ncbi:MAG TPA: protein kinase [Ktedonobacterales bacterium]|nr:protein kinase [Ktedonobacterales bacterium]